MKRKKLPTKKHRVIFLVFLALATFALEYYRPGKLAYITSILFFILFIYELKQPKQ